MPEYSTGIGLTPDARPTLASTDGQAEDLTNASSLWRPVRPEEFIIFLHIQKCGGLTIQRMLRRHYGPSVLRRTFARLRDRPLNKRKLDDFTPRDRYFQGHLCYGMHQSLPQPYRYFTFLREPVSRLVSLYKHSRRFRKAYYHKHAKAKSIENFLLDTPLKELDNGMTRFIAGDENDRFINRTPVGACTESLLNKAISNIEKDFFMVGILEDFDQSVLLMKKMLGWQRAFYLKRNSGEEENIVLPSSVIDLVREKNALDVALYERYRGALKEAFATRFSEPDEVIDRFRRSNAHYNRLVPLYDLYDRCKVYVAGKGERPM